ncbi:hypothetical protein MAPG_11144 [Magnaporthiopsis poae ATCC 64411]|uniref:Hsp70-like protein n=1 Tax=Magnaporthiopsis poae (strain ATCC 64411 / 73-15) TaxID=644358 RepID=A0A0C4EEH1_MAGP6|nr:hypothetical protein MAPG_11144 [Magnaporthiopsis poae ATCC 64411]
MEHFFRLFRGAAPRSTAVQRPDILVSVDFGTTYTGMVPRKPLLSGYLFAVNSDTPIRVIQAWPCTNRAEKKVPSQIMYHDDDRILSKDENRVSSWGFGCAYEAAISTREPFSLFKLFVDRAMLGTRQSSGQAYKVPATHGHALQIATDYLRCLYKYMEGYIVARLPGDGEAAKWGNLAIEFVFSMPTTWLAPEILHDLKNCIFDAGFARDHKRHRVVLDLTEAEAAAIAVLKSSNIDFRQGDLFLCIDAGGGTTDLALVKVPPTDAEYDGIDQVGTAQGLAVGSTLINGDFQRLVQKRIDANSEGLADAHGITPDTAARMACSVPFENFKKSFGNVLSGWQLPYMVRVEELPANASLPGLEVERGHMGFSREEFQSLFDGHIATIIGEVRGFLSRMKKDGYDNHVKKIVLSGGLGASAYVGSELEKAFRDDPHERAKGAALICAKDPQLVVVRGLLLNRQHDLRRGKPVLTTRNARASYGIVVNALFDPERHALEDMEPDPISPKKKWARGQIAWLVKKGEKLDPSKPPVCQFTMPILREDSYEWTFEMVQYDGDVETLPSNVKSERAVKICILKSNLSGIDKSKLVTVKMDTKYPILSKKKYKACRFEFEIVAIIGPVDLRFEVQVQGERFSDNHRPLSMNWAPPGGGCRARWTGVILQ